MKKVLCACLAMLVLLCGAAMAEHFRCELPEGAWLGDTTPLREGDALLLTGGKALYRVSLADGSAEKLADMPEVFIAGDSANGPSLVVRAIVDGRKTAAQIDRYLSK